jgi:hypothetical protein
MTAMIAWVVSIVSAVETEIDARVLVKSYNANDD